MTGDLFSDIKAADAISKGAAITVTGVLVGLLIGKAIEIYGFNKFVHKLEKKR